MVYNLTLEEDQLINKIAKLHFKESLIRFSSVILSAICPLSLVAISIVDAFYQSNLLRLMIILLYPLSIMAMSFNRRLEGIAKYVPLLLLVLIVCLVNSISVYLCVVGIAASYHMQFNSIPILRTKLETVTKSPMYASAIGKILKNKMNDKKNQR